jgi:hypothetical protein
MSEFGPPERVYVETEWYDGPRAGIADVGGVPHRFKSQFDDTEDDHLGTYLVWPVDARVLALEIEQWQIFVVWNDLYESGASTVAAHPGHGGVSVRWDEIQAHLQTDRANVPADARRAKVRMEHLNQERRYAPSGPGYKLCWHLL